MNRSLTHLLPAVLATAAVALVAGAAPAQALDSCSAGTPCLPLHSAFTSVVPAQEGTKFVGNRSDDGVLIGVNSEVGGESSSGVAGYAFGTNRGSGVFGTLGFCRFCKLDEDSAGVYGKVESSVSRTRTAGVRGEVTGVTGSGSNGIGVLGIHDGSGVGVAGASIQVGGIGVLGYAPTGQAPPKPPVGGLAGLFMGDVQVQGTLTKSAGAFRIDHPLDPEHKYLQHAFVESPQMLNVYNGNVQTDAKGFATVQLPRYFQALNRDFRYQLTVIGRSFAQAVVWREIAGNRFRIRTSEPKVEVSWQVTGVREDAYANRHRIQVEVAKTGPAASLADRIERQLAKVTSAGREAAGS